MVDGRGLGTGSGFGMRFPLAAARETINPPGAARRRLVMTIDAILSGKGREVATVRAEQSVAEAVAILGERRIGALPVVEGDRIAGIMSERDVIYCLRTHGAEVLSWPVERVMTAPAITVGPTDAILSALALMTKRRIRHLPVVDHEGICGIVSIGDLVKHRIEKIEAEAEAMRSYIQSA
jgi:CBS domain-containing protein